MDKIYIRDLEFIGYHGVFELYNREGKKFKELVFKKGKKIEEREIK